MDVCVFLGGATKTGLSESVCGGPFRNFFACPTERNKTCATENEIIRFAEGKQSR